MFNCAFNDNKKKIDTCVQTTHLRIETFKNNPKKIYCFLKSSLHV